MIKMVLKHDFTNECQLSVNVQCQMNVNVKWMSTIGQMSIVNLHAFFIFNK